MYDVMSDPWQRVFDPAGVQIGGADCRKVNRCYSHSDMAISSYFMLHSIGAIIYGECSREVCVVVDTSLLEVCLQICK